MPVRIYYIDESYDKTKFCLSAISIRYTTWVECFERVRNHRKQLKETHGLFMRKEIHATDFVRGRGRISKVPIPKWTRARIFKSFLQLISELPNVQILNICLPQHGLADAQMKAWDRLTNRIEAGMRIAEQSEVPLRQGLIQKLSIAEGMKAGDIEACGSRLADYKARAVIIADEGREGEITKALRKMHVHNLIPSQFGQWEPGVKARNITTDRIIEDPVFKQSHRSYFLQLADCVSFALLKKEVPPTPSIKRYDIHKMFDETVARVCVIKAAKDDPLGIVRR